MFDVRKVRPSPQFHYFFLMLFALSSLAMAQNKDKDKDEKEKKKTAAPYVDVEGEIRCEKADPLHTIVVPDRPGHAMMLEKRKCTWTKPLVVLGAKTKNGEANNFVEKMEGTLHVHGFETDDLDNNEKMTWQTMGQVLAEKGPAAVKGRWTIRTGTGKLKGIKGGGTYEGKLSADDVLVVDVEGVYDPSELVAEKK
jgi:hypothetical protein